jgi:hypothetical protein
MPMARRWLYSVHAIKLNSTSHVNSSAHVANLYDLGRVLSALARGRGHEPLRALEQRRPLYAGVAPHNIASIRVLQKCGFTLCQSAIDQDPELVGESHILLTLAAPIPMNAR